jgi:hypothetical protein
MREAVAGYFHNSHFTIYLDARIEPVARIVQSLWPVVAISYEGESAIVAVVYLQSWQVVAGHLNDFDEHLVCGFANG